MMATEFVDAVREVSIGRFPTPNHFGGTSWRVVHAFYQSRHLDAVCVGPDRHQRFARWIIANEDRISRVIGRIRRSEGKRREALETQLSAIRWQLDGIGVCPLR